MPYRDCVLSSSSAIESYVGLDLEFNHFDRGVKPDLVWDGCTIPLPDESVDVAFATEVLEHCPEPLQVIREVHRVLKTGGVFLFTTPFLWPLHEVPYDYHRFTPFHLQMLMEEVGLGVDEMSPLGGWDASLAQMMGLWLIRRPGLNPVLRKLLRWIFVPIIALLHKIDSTPREFSESQMITGIRGAAIKSK